MRIGEVHALLRSEFPGIELSKIRYYEDKGLVAPSRSKKGYRLYSERDVECLREAFRLAQQEYVPLKVIRQRLIDQGLLEDELAVRPSRTAASSSVSTVSAPYSPPVASERISEVHSASAPAVPDGFLPRLSLEEMVEVTALSERQIGELVDFGLLSPRVSAGRLCFDEFDVEVAKRFTTLAKRGVDVRSVQGLRRTVDRQVDIVHSVTAPIRLRAQRSGALSGADETRIVAEELHALRSALLDRAMRNYFDA
jgi:DNA-binding transcriptional MerR regulator